MNVTGIMGYLSAYSGRGYNGATEITPEEVSFWEALQNRNGVADFTADDASSYGNPASLIADSVQQTLLKYQETGTVFEEETKLYMLRRGVSEEEMTRFSAIVNDAAGQGAYADPMAYIKTLPDHDVEIIRKVHGLAETTGVTGATTQEGAINLLLPPSRAVDIDNNGMVESGQATVFQFPPPNAPQAVKDAWESMTADMSLKERMTAEFPFLVQSTFANLKEDVNGNVVGLYEPAETGYTNIFGTTEQSWNELFDHMKTYQEGLSVYDPVGAAKNIEMINRFAHALTAQGGATPQPTGAETEAPQASARKVDVVNGKSVIVSGHNLDARAGVSLLRTVNMSMSAFNPDNWETQPKTFANTQIIELVGGMTEVSGKALDALPPGAINAYMNIDRMRPAGQWYEDPIKVPIDEHQNYYRRTTQALMEVVEVERELKKTYGDDIKLIYSHTEDSYVMLTKDDARYHDMQSAESAVQKVIEEVHLGDIDRESVADILHQYGYTV